jgi:hypothetical protein
VFAGGAAAAASAGLPRQARAIEMADLLLALSADVSRSLDAEKFRLQRDGYAAAISDPRVVRLIQGGPHQRIAICFIEWSGVGAVSMMVDWSMISNRSEAEGFAEKVRVAPRLFMDRTSISTGIDFALAQLAKCPFGAERRVIDISGDGTHNSGRPVTTARDEAVAQGVTINGIAILSAVPLAFNPAHTHPPGGLLKYFEDNVTGGNGAFALAAEGFQDFGQAIVQKLIKEIAAPAPAVRHA